jgi:hypothetical protein
VYRCLDLSDFKNTESILIQLIQQRPQVNTKSILIQKNAFQRIIQVKKNTRECCFRTDEDNKLKIVWEIIFNCPSKCEYCFQERTEHKNYISQAQLSKIRKKVYSFLEEVHPQQVLFSGGEPLTLGDGLIEAIEIAKNLGAKFSLSTTVRRIRGQVLNLESLSLLTSLSIFLRTFLSLAMVFATLRTAWDTADSLTLNCSPIVLSRSDVYR